MKILIIQQKIGDVLKAALCNNLRRLPDAQIDYLVYESTTPVLEGNQILTRLYVSRKAPKKQKGI
jgi:heptosyltransferase-2